MSLFGKKEKKIIMSLTQELAYKNREIARKDQRIDQLVQLCEEKDEFFKGAISDALRHGSSAAGRHMADRKKYLNGNV